MNLAVFRRGAAVPERAAAVRAVADSAAEGGSAPIDGWSTTDIRFSPALGLAADVAPGATGATKTPRGAAQAVAAVRMAKVFSATLRSYQDKK